MKILGIETATSVCAVAIVDNGAVLNEVKIEAQHSHSEKIISLVDKCLRSVKLELKSLNGIAVSIGPGSFTGLRIGLSVAKGFSYAGELPLVGIPTLEALAWNAFNNKLVNRNDFILPLIDARRAEVYLALYTWNGQKLEESITSCAMLLKEIEYRLPANGNIVILGDGSEKFREFAKIAENDNLSRYIIPERNDRLCSAAAVAMLGEKKITMNGTDDIKSMEPLYVKDFYTLVKTQHHEVKL